MAAKPRLAVFKFASCDGCQLSLLDCEDELLAVAERVEIAYFLEAGAQDASGSYDVGLVEGSVTTPHDLERYAARLNLDVPAFTTALEQHTYQPEVQADFMSGVRSGVGGTPTFYINGVRYDGNYDEEDLKKAIQKAIRLAR